MYYYRVQNARTLESYVECVCVPMIEGYLHGFIRNRIDKETYEKENNHGQ